MPLGASILDLPLDQAPRRGRRDGPPGAGLDHARAGRRAPTASDLALWNPDGSTTGDLDAANWIAALSGHLNTD